MNESIQELLNPANGDALLTPLHGALDTARAAITDIKTTKRPSAETLAAFDRLHHRLACALNLASLLQSVHPLADVRAAAETAEQEWMRFATDLSLDRALYDALVALNPGALDPLARRLLDKTLTDFRRSGVDRDETTRARLRELSERIVDVSQRFERAIREGARTIDAAPGELAGLPDDFVAAHPVEASGTVRLSTDPTDYLPVMLYADSAALRERLYRVRQSIAPENNAILSELLALRHEQARLVGFPTYAHYATAEKMIRTPEAAQRFIDDVVTAARPAAQNDLGLLLDEKRRTEPAADTVWPWESQYLLRRVKGRVAAFDPAELRRYFAPEAVLAGVLDTSAALYGLRFTEAPDAPAWHPSVRVFEVADTTGAAIGRIYLDLYPRENKYKHAAMFGIEEGVAGRAKPAGAIVANFPTPVADGSARWEHDQVETFFHEFGHLLHHLLGGGSRFARFSGVATEWDFVEVPSQLYEEWAWDAERLATFARDAEGRAIPAELVAKARRAEELGKGQQVMQQMFYAALALGLYDRDPQGLVIRDFVDEKQRAYSMYPVVSGTAFENTFGHLVGYASNYYTYMWSLAIVKDIAAVFKKAGLMEATTAARYRRTILAPGGERDAAELVRDFLGREWNLDAFHAWLAQSA